MSALVVSSKPAGQTQLCQARQSCSEVIPVSAEVGEGCFFKPMDGRVKDYIAMPKQNGYQSLHTTVITNDKQIVEFQIRTREMHDYAERGLAATFYYNEQKLTSAYAEGRINKLPSHLLWIKELQESAAKLASGEKIDRKKLKLNLFADKIFVYTPKGDIIDLPKGSMPLDFAYRLHSEIGAQCTGAIVNGKMVDLKTKLNQGDVVEIVTAKHSKPNSGWLDKVFSSHARHKIVSQLRSIIPNFVAKPKKNDRDPHKQEDQAALVDDKGRNADHHAGFCGVLLFHRICVLRFSVIKQQAPRRKTQTKHTR